MERIESIVILLNQKLEAMSPQGSLKAIYKENVRTIEVGDVTRGRVLRVPIEKEYFLSFPLLLKAEIEQLLTIFQEEDKKRIEGAIILQETSLFLC